MFDRHKILDIDLPIKKDLLRFFRKQEKLLIFDIGSCEGEDAIRYSRLFPNARIFAFEPLPKNQQLILDNISQYHASNVRLFEMALSKTEGMQDFHVSSGHPSDTNPPDNWDFGNKSSSLLAPQEVLDAVKWLKFDNKIEVYTNTLQNIITGNQVNTIDFVHMDVQGAELDVLIGAGDCIQNIKLIWLEVAETSLYRNQPLRKDIEDFMSAHSFKLLKTQLENGVGDQLYMNTHYFTEHAFLGLTKYKRNRL
ncbi:FkbM family methyltransferase [Mucilaginibacter sp. cycad4]|uniref:FkbM family methyltransferase n=1 Tax=Mucilaginibacter sp. cycad4 TaxID=3342096 RepID=UPI002AAAE488|nr:FkbM family methyltransferase [Mucilaginibacter gossypii]WPU98339.1 FkbM family methyltransferase [Mucilaginibacter gossypii]